MALEAFQLVPRGLVRLKQVKVCSFNKHSCLGQGVQSHTCNDKLSILQKNVQTLSTQLLRPSFVRPATALSSLRLQASG